MRHIEEIRKEEYLGGEVVIRGKAVCGIEFTYSHDDEPSDSEPVCKDCLNPYRDQSDSP